MQIRLLALVGGKKVTNPFTFTEVYINKDEGWKLATLAFTKLPTP